MNIFIQIPKCLIVLYDAEHTIRPQALHHLSVHLSVDTRLILRRPSSYLVVSLLKVFVQLVRHDVPLGRKIDS